MVRSFSLVSASFSLAAATAFLLPTNVCGQSLDRFAVRTVPFANVFPTGFPPQGAVWSPDSRLLTFVASDPQIGTPGDMQSCLNMITVQPAKLMRLADYGIAVGLPADVVVLDCTTEARAIAEIAPVLAGYKRGRQSFTRPAGRLFPPT